VLHESYLDIRSLAHLLLLYAPLLSGIGGIGTFISVLVAICVARRGFRENLKKADLDREIRSVNTVMSLYERFYQMHLLSEADRIELEYDFFEKWAPAMEKWLVYPDRLSNDDKLLLARIDRLLNFFERVARLTELKTEESVLRKSEFVTKEEEESVFNYWFQVVMKDDSHAVLRRYLTHGFEYTYAIIGLPKSPLYVATYGTLMTGQVNTLTSEIKVRMVSRGPCTIPGEMFVAGPNGEYPGLTYQISSNSQAHAELFEIGADDEKTGENADDKARDVLQALDRYEEYDPDDTRASLYVRRFVMVKLGSEGGLEAQKVGAWVYFYNRDSDQIPGIRIPSGDWRSYQAAKTQKA
jgi:gamma-glutamylcyclotransferase (GGCT)/AIG2-like uncharacterized protein YtfP